jgi:3-oxoisoapionate kinase
LQHALGGDGAHPWTTIEHAVDRCRRDAGDARNGAQRGIEALSLGRDPLLITAHGPDDPTIANLRTQIEAVRASMAVINDRIGAGLGHALDQILQTARLERAIIAGGDTAGHAARTMGIYGLTAVAPLASGAPLCRAVSDREHSAIEISLKGGQVGEADFFCLARDGSSRR